MLQEGGEGAGISRVSKSGGEMITSPGYLEVERMYSIAHEDGEECPGIGWGGGQEAYLI